MTITITRDDLVRMFPRASTFKPDTYGEHWETVRPWVERACNEADGWWTIEALDQLLIDDKALLWVLAKANEPVAAVVTTINDWDGRKVAEILITGGAEIIAEATTHLGKIEVWARKQGASEIYIRGRRGWARAMKQHGYDEIAVTLRKAL